MNKISLGVVGLLIAGAIYYFTAGASQITAEIKKQVNNELTLASSNGFLVEERKSNPKSEHFVLSFDDTKKITHFLDTQGLHVKTQDLQQLKGLKLGVDLHYLADAYSAVSMDLYPLTLPKKLQDAMQKPEDKELLSQLNALLQKKAILMHLDMNKVGTGFKGYVKDINETFTGKAKVNILMKGMTFKGDIENKKPNNITQNAKEMKVTIGNEMDMALKGMKSVYTKTGKTAYDYQTSYTIDKIEVDTNKGVSMLLDTLKADTKSTVKNNLASGEMSSKINSITVKAKGEERVFETFIFNTKASNLDVAAIEKLNKLNQNNPKDASVILQELISKGVQLDISDLSVKDIQNNKQSLGGFTLLAHLDIDKSLNIQATNRNPLAALNGIDANLKITLDNALFSYVAKQPQAMMMLMLFQPKDVNGKKVYTLEVGKGKLLVNGIPVN